MAFRLSPVRRVAVAVATVAALALTGCGSSSADEGLPDVNITPQASPEAAGPYAQPPSVVGLLVSADNKQVVLVMPDKSRRVFLVRESDALRIGIEHLASHAGLTDIGFRVTYETVDGKDYILGARETAPPR
ncbi:hypothetical protein AB0M43_21545 [Longispora sp. NPDC051575]|uniref:hypothetical protein n=1 Tax=Longispora sp. NPDC051575 TaxID=3154943 RepID=UPI0034476074